MRTFTHQRFLAAAGSLMLFAGLGLVLPGCDTFDSNRTDAAMEPIEFSIHPSTSTILAGEVVTFTTRSANTLGRETAIEWSTTGGSLETEQNKRIARVRFDEPGTYRVNAVLRVDDQVTKTDEETVTVRPVTP